MAAELVRKAPVTGFAAARCRQRRASPIRVANNCGTLASGTGSAKTRGAARSLADQASASPSHARNAPHSPSRRLSDRLTEHNTSIGAWPMHVARFRIVTTGRLGGNAVPAIRIAPAPARWYREAGASGIRRHPSRRPSRLVTRPRTRNPISETPGGKPRWSRRQARPAARPETDRRPGCPPVAAVTGS